MKKILSLLIGTILLNGCSAFYYGNTRNIHSVTNNELDDNYYATVSVPINGGFGFVMVGIIIPIIPIPYYRKCDGKTDVRISINAKQGRIDPAKLKKSINIEFQGDEGIVYNKLTELKFYHDGQEFHGIKYETSFPIPCDKWKSATVKAENPYLENTSQEPIVLTLKKRKGFFYIPILINN